MSGRVTVNEGGNFAFDWGTEFDIRDALAEIAQLTGWIASTEHVVNGWGRPDIYLEASLTRIAVEVKTELQTRSACRKAIQQTAGYRRAMPEVELAILVAAEINEAAMIDYKLSYPEVWVLTAHEFINFLRREESTLLSRRCRASLRISEARQDIEKQSRAWLGLPALASADGAVAP